MQALTAARLLAQLEGIIPALESAHAFAFLEKLMPTTSKKDIVVVNLSGRGDKDMMTYASQKVEFRKQNSEGKSV
jgi:tryptophan synthase beta chain